MLGPVPRRTFFQFEIPLHYCTRVPQIDGDVSKWTRKYLLPPLVEIEDGKPIADVYCGWREDGFFAAFDVPNRPGRLHCDARQWWKGDGLRLCLNTREARDIKRGTRFCHFFYLLPTGGGPHGRSPIAGVHRMSRAKEPPPPVDLSLVKIAVQVDRRGWSVEVALPAECLTGWETADHPRIGLFYKVKDTHLGSQHLTADDELGWNVDPSTWATGVLVR
jgi:hypothetical protein